MTKVINTQTEDLVNFENIIKISMIPGTYDNVEVYAIVAQPVGMRESEDEIIQLGIYEDAEKCGKIMDNLKKWLRDNLSTVFDMAAEE